MTRRMITLTCALAGLLASAPCLAADGSADWPMWRHNPARTAVTQHELPGNLSLQWVRREPPPERTWKSPINQERMTFDRCYEPVVMGKLLFYGSSRSDRLVAVDTETGAEKWRFYTDGPVRFAPACGGGKVYLASDDGFLYCLNAADGKLLWKFRGAPSARRVIGNERLISMWPARGGPVLVDGKVYFAASIWPFMGIFIHCLDAETGKVVWTNDGSGSTWQPQPHGGSYAFAGVAPQGYMAVGSGKLVIPSGRTHPACYDLATGKFLWFPHQEAGHVGGTHVFIEGSKVVCNGVSLNLSDGKKGGSADNRMTTIRAGSRSISSGSYRVDGTAVSLIAADRKAFVSTAQGSIYCFGERGGGRTIQGGSVAPAPGSPSGDAAALVRAAGTSEGWCLVFGLGTGKLAESVARGTKMQVVVIEPDPAKTLAARLRLDAAGLYGKRLAIINVEPTKMPLPPYFASLVVCEDSRAAGFGSDGEMAKKAWYSLRPYGGVFCAPASAKAALAGAVPGAATGSAGNFATLKREGALPGSAPWTHQYADESNSLVSKDKLVKLPLGITWFGGSSHDAILPRHGHGPPEQVMGGRMVIEGPNGLRALDVYSGRVMWDASFPGLGDPHNTTKHQPGANALGTNYIVTEDTVYVAYKNSCVLLDPATGQRRSEFRLPGGGKWGFISRSGDILIGGEEPMTFRQSKINPRDYNRFMENWNNTLSKRIVAMDRKSGKVLWKLDSQRGFRHNAICIGGGKLYAIDRLPEAVSRGGGASLIAVDLKSGKPAWTAAQKIFGTWLGYSAENGVLLEAGRSGRDMLQGEPRREMTLYRGADGSVVWRKTGGDSYGGPPILHHKMIINEFIGHDLMTGKLAMRTDPLTGNKSAWNFRRRYGCGTPIASEYLLTFRSGAAGYYDLQRDGGTGNFGGFKSGCTSNLIAADGVLNAPDYTRTCTCSYQNQCSLAFAHMPDEVIELWHETPFRPSGKIVRMGVNLGAPGDRKCDAGTLWLDYPSKGGRSPDVTVRVSGGEYFRRHSMNIGGTGHRWVAASGVKGATSVTVGLGGGGSYNVRLYFCEPDEVEPGKRVFDVAVEGGSGVRGLDVVKAAGGRLRSLVKEMKGVQLSGSLKVRLTPQQGSLPPVISGIEIVASNLPLGKLVQNPDPGEAGAVASVGPGAGTRSGPSSAGRPARTPARPAGDPRKAKVAHEKLQKVIIAAAARKKPRISIDMGGRPQRGRLVGADDKGITVQVMGARMSIKWSAVKPKRFAAIAGKCGADAKLLLEYRQAAGME